MIHLTVAVITDNRFQQLPLLNSLKLASRRTSSSNIQLVRLFTPKVPLCSRSRVGCGPMGERQGSVCARAFATEKAPAARETLVDEGAFQGDKYLDNHKNKKIKKPRDCSNLNTRLMWFPRKVSKSARPLKTHTHTRLYYRRCTLSMC